MTTKSFTVRNYLTAFLECPEQEDAETEKEQEMLLKIAARIADSLPLEKFPAFAAELKEFNHSQNKAGAMMRAEKTSIDGVSALGTLMPRALYRTTFSQKYKAVNHTDADQNYDGELTVSVITAGVWSSSKQCYEANEDAAETIAVLVCGFYYRNILKYYPEWTTEYVDAPVSKTEVVEHL